MTFHEPKWLKLLFNIRDIIVKQVGVRLIKGFTPSQIIAIHPAKSKLPIFLPLLKTLQKN